MGAVVALLLIVAVHGDALGAQDVWVNGAQMRVERPITVERALDAARVRLHAGPLIAVDGSVLDPQAFAARIWVDGDRATPSDVVPHRGRLVGRHGPRRDEPSDLSTRPIPAPWPGVERWVSSAPVPGSEIVRTGRVSGRTVREELVREPSPARPLLDAPTVALTFDDGPGPRTNEILDILTARGVPATFFVVGSMMRLHPDVVRREIASGMTLGNHSWSHSLAFETLNYQTVVDEILATDGAITALGGRRPEFFRPPKGLLLPQVRDAARDTGHRLLLWAIDPADYRHPPPDLLVQRVVAALKPGAVVVLHDGGGTANTTVAALPALLDAIAGAGYRVVSLH